MALASIGIPDDEFAELLRRRPRGGVEEIERTHARRNLDRNGQFGLCTPLRSADGGGAAGGDGEIEPERGDRAGADHVERLLRPLKGPDRERVARFLPEGAGGELFERNRNTGDFPHGHVQFEFRTGDRAALRFKAEHYRDSIVVFSDFAVVLYDHPAAGAADDQLFRAERAENDLLFRPAGVEAGFLRLSRNSELFAVDEDDTAVGGQGKIAADPVQADRLLHGEHRVKLRTLRSGGRDRFGDDAPAAAGQDGAGELCPGGGDAGFLLLPVLVGDEAPAGVADSDLEGRSVKGEGAVFLEVQRFRQGCADGGDAGEQKQSGENF